MKKTILALLVFMVFTCLLLPQQEYVLRIQKGMPSIPLAIPDFLVRGDSAELQQAAADIHTVFQADMAYSRIFNPLPANYYKWIRALDTNDLHFKDWESIQARLLVVGEVSQEGADILFEAKVYDVRSERFIFGKRYQAEKSLLREAAHRLSNEIMRIHGETEIFTTKIVFVSNRDGNDEIYMMDYDGYNQTRLTFNTLKDYMPAWTTDGKGVAFTSYRDQRAELRILYPWEGRVTTLDAQGTNWAPNFSADGKKLAFSSTLTAGNSEIYTADADGKNIKRLTINNAADTAPCWSPTSRQMAFTSDRSGTPQIYTMDAEGSNVRRVSFGGTYHDAPAWSPDGDRIAYVSRVDQIFDIYILNLSSQQIIKLTESYARNESPTWSPDGRHVIFTSTRSGTIQIYSMDYDGKNVRKLTSQGENKLPDWSR